VDVNPLAVDLCKLALWLEGHWTGKPLSFLDHRVKCGNSLIGVLDMKTPQDGIPDEAFNPVTGDIKSAALEFKRKNRSERREWDRLRNQGKFRFDIPQHLREYAEIARQVSAIEENTPKDVHVKAEAYERWKTGMKIAHDRSVADFWTYAFFAPLGVPGDPNVPTHKLFMDYLAHFHNPKHAVALAEAFSFSHRFFHWPLEFPEVFERSGFDVVIGNPPWDVIQPEEVKFFAAHGAPDIAQLPGDKRKKVIDKLSDRSPILADLWQKHVRDIDSISCFVRGSGRFDLSAVGKLNTYSLFADLARQLSGPSGKTGVIVPTGIATDDSNKKFFADLNQKRSLVSLFDFENRDGIFPGVHRSYKFSLLTIGRNATQQAEFAFFLTQAEQITDGRRRFTLSANDIALLNPNTHTCPIFRAKQDAQLTKKLYDNVPVLIVESKQENPWGVRFQQGMFNMTSDSNLFIDSPRAGYLRLYEAKMIHQFDHRWAGYNSGVAYDCPIEEKTSPTCVVQPRYWVAEREVKSRVSDWQHKWFVGFRNVCRATDERTMIASFVPWAGVGHSLPLIFADAKPPLLACLVANLNAIVLDYVVRQKIGGINLSFFIVQQLPLLAPQKYDEHDVKYVVGRVAKLACVADDLESLRTDLGGESGIFDPEERSHLKAELDAYYAHLYGLTRDELIYVLDPTDLFGLDFPGETFRVLKDRELRELGEFRTRRLVLEAYDKLSQTVRFRGRVHQRESILSAVGGDSNVAGRGGLPRT
jgi:hypothetical protein